MLLPFLVQVGNSFSLVGFCCGGGGFVGHVWHFASVFKGGEF
jgi:hypothetical protein